MRIYDRLNGPFSITQFFVGDILVMRLKLVGALAVEWR